ncbi:matrixin family metalloprotease [Aliidiomarina sp. Khilg15.8]
MRLVSLKFGLPVVVLCGLLVPGLSAASEGTLPQALQCRSPLYLHLDTLSEEFNLSRLEASLALQEAADMWNEAVGDNMLRIQHGKGIPVRFIYDHRQQMLEKFSAEDAALEAQSDELTDYRAEVSALIEELDEAAEALESPQSRRDPEAHNKAVQRYNENVQVYLDKQQDFNAKVAEFNSRQERLRSARLEAQQGFSEQGLDGQSGDYRGGWTTRNGRPVSPLNESISVYKFGSQQTLVAILAHEIGHAIGMGHVSGHSSIMSPTRNEGPGYNHEPARLSTLDIEAVQRVCE